MSWGALSGPHGLASTCGRAPWLDCFAMPLHRAQSTKLGEWGAPWGVGGWLLPNFLAKAGQEVAARLRARVVAELKTTFASHYTDEISLSRALQPEIVARYYAKTTGEKFLVCPQMDL